MQPNPEFPADLVTFTEKIFCVVNQQKNKV